jgi:hypothetical protein
VKIIAFEPDYNEKHRAVLRALSEGIPGAEVRTLGQYEPCDIAVIFGAAKDAYPPTWPKREILAKHQGRRLLMVESAFVRRGEYYQVGWGGYAGNADFNNDLVPRDRWESMGIKTKPWQRRTVGPVVVCGQLPRDTQVQGMDHVAWCRRTVNELRRMGEHVIFRPHPRQQDVSIYGVPSHLIDDGKIGNTLAAAKCVVTWNSTSAVDALIRGVPAIAMHPSSVSYPVAQPRIEDVKKLRYPSRRQWLAGLGYAQWTLEEMRAGLPWVHLNR